MAKFYGNVGYVTTVETSPGVYTERVVIHTYRGDLLRNRRRLDNSSKVNSDIDISNEVSIVADPYAQNHFFEIRWVEFQNSKWTVSDVTVDYPRLTLTLGGLYNGST